MNLCILEKKKLLSFIYNLNLPTELSHCFPTDKLVSLSSLKYGIFISYSVVLVTFFSFLENLIKILGNMGNFFLQSSAEVVPSA